VVDDYSIAALAFSRIKGGIGSDQHSGKILSISGIDDPEAGGVAG
jgi:hypothetical protein